jgi:predicted ATPase/DNA-binding SARP family transcriptional activator/biotin operon repressor
MTGCQMPTLRARVLGGLALDWDDRPLPPIRGSTARSVLAYLIIHGQHSHTRDLLAGTFWPDLPDAAARRRLSQALWQIRRAFGPHLILQAEGNMVQINPDLPLWLDAAEFERLAAGVTTEGAAPDTDRLQKAVDLYRGELLAGYYDEWALTERERLRDLFLALLERLVEVGKQRGEYEHALLHARRLAAEDPWREEAHCEVMRLCHLLGRSAEALKQFEVCRKALNDELGAEPSDATLVLAQEIAQRSLQESMPYLPLPAPGLLRAPAATAISLPLGLVGREIERATLVSDLEAAVDGLGGLVLIEGESGVGKTRLLQEVARDAEWRGFHVLWGRCRASAGAAPFGPWVEALQAAISPLRVEQWSRLVDRIWLQVLCPLFPAMAVTLPGLSAPPRVEPEREQERIVNALAQLLTVWSQSVPLALVLEDLHWADADSLGMLSALGQRFRKERVLIVASYRGDEARNRPEIWRELQALHRAGLRQRLALAPLDQTATGELVRRGLGMRLPAPLFASRLYRETGGNPLFVLEVLRALYDEGTLFQDKQGEWSTAWDETTSDYAELVVPAAVERVIARRLALLKPDERAALETAAVLGQEFSFHHLQQTGEQEGCRLLAAVENLVRRQLLVERPAAYQFGHDEILRVAYRSIDPEKRKAIHRRAAAAQEALLPDPPLGKAALAHHLAQGEVWDRAVDAYAAAGREAASVYAAESALRAYEQAITILQAHQPFSSGLQASCHFDLLAARCSLLHLQADREVWRADVDAMLALAHSLGDPELHVEALLQQAEFLDKSASEYEAARQTAEKALALAQERGLCRAQARAWLTIGTAWKQQGHSAPALVAYQRALDAHQAGTAEAIDVYVNLVMTYRDMGNLDKAQEVARIALEQAQAGDDPLVTARVHNAMAWIARALGNHQAEADHCQAMLAHMRAVGHRYYEGVALNNLSLAYSALGHYGPAIKAGEQALAVFRQIDHRHGQVITLLNLSSRYKATGQPAQAQRVLVEGLDLARDLSLVDDEVRILSSLSELLTNAGQYTAAGEALDRAERLARELRSAYLLATAHFRAGELALATANYERAVEQFEHSLQQYEASGYAHYQTTTRSFLAAAHHRLGNLATAVRLSIQAVAEAESRPGTPPSLDLYLHHYQVMTAAGEPETAYAALQGAYDQLQERLATLDNPAWQSGFVEEMPLHRQIVAAWDALQPRRLVVRLPRAGAPVGRALRDDEYVAVSWTVDAPEDRTVSDRASRRQARLARLLREAAGQGATPTIDDLAAALAVSQPTVRRDLATLRQAGYPVETRGSRCIRGGAQN